MAIIKADALDSVLRKPASDVAAILIYGADSSAVRDTASRAVKRLAGAFDDPFSVVVLEESNLASDPGRLIDEVQSQSLLGGNRVIWVRGAEQSFLRAAEAILNGSVRGNMIVAEAGSLAKGSALRSKFETASHLCILPLYDATADDSIAWAEAALAKLGFRIDRDALALLQESAGAGSAVLAREVDKLALYCLGNTNITAADVRAICGNASGVEADDLVDAVLGGDLVEADRYFQHLTAAGVDPGRLLSMAHGHVVRLIDCHRQVDRGLRIEQAVKSARPPIFFKRQAAVQSQLQAWELTTLLAAAASLNGAILQARLNAPLAESLSNRALLAIARSARSQRVRLN